MPKLEIKADGLTPIIVKAVLLKRKNLRILINVVSNPYNKVTGCLSVCLSVCQYQRISLTTEPIRFTFTG